MLLAPLLAAAWLAAPQASAPPAPPPPTATQAAAFLDGVDAELRRLLVRQSRAAWIQATDITDDTEANAAALNEDLLAYRSAASKAAVAFEATATDPAARRKLRLLRLAQTLPAPSDPARRAELASLAARLEGLYGKGKWCPAAAGPAPSRAPGDTGQAADPARCRDLGDLEEVLRKSRDWDELTAAWAGWHATAREMRPLYSRLVELGNEGSRELGFADLGELWRSGYDMTPAELRAETDRLWAEVQPFYRQLHCYARARLQARHGRERVPDGAPIPAQLLGNMWAQEWGNLEQELTPFPGRSGAQVDGALAAQGWDPVRMVRLGEAFFSSLGFAPLPETFWTRSMLVKPRDREVVCHASAWDVTWSSDLRIKMCIKPTGEDLTTIHHELGHNYYQRAYAHLPVLFQDGANDGFHEAIGDAIALSITPAYLKRVGLLAEVPRDAEGTLNVQMAMALEKVAFLPFGLLVDRWRWDVFSGKTPPARYGEAWWALRRELQGVAPPLPRGEADFDPGAKYHVAAGVPYTRYFLARIYQFQLHQALCQAAGWQGPLHECSIHGSLAAGQKLQAMLAMGASRPWPEAYEAITGSRRADASALLAYFAPLRAWLEQENAGRRCGW